MNSFVILTSIVLIFVQNSSSFFTDAGMNSNSRIVGGKFAEENQFPHHASITYDEIFICGGSIISSTFILTAAHCVSYKIERFGIVVGTNNLKFDTSQLLEIEKIKIHEGYINNFLIVINDIALVMLKKPLEFSLSVKPIQMETEEIPVGSNVTIIGFGRDSIHHPESEFLKFNDEIYVESNNGCSYAFFNFDSIICLGSELENGACSVSFFENMENLRKSLNFIFFYSQGDSGGSAIHNGKIVGITSYGYVGIEEDCGFNPDSYTKVSFYVGWIENSMKQMSSGPLKIVETTN